MWSSVASKVRLPTFGYGQIRMTELNGKTLPSAGDLTEIEC